MRLVLLVFLTLVATANAAPTNIVVILADDLGYADIGCFDGWVKTPHLDALAKAGRMLTDFHSSGAVCSPTRAGLMTGRYQQRVGIPGVVTAKGHRDKGLTTNHLAFAEVLKKQGYSTAIYGKWHLGYDPKNNPVHHGFDRFRGYVSGNIDFFSHIDQTGIYDWWKDDKLIEEPGYVTHLITKHGVRFIEENKDRPFCLYLAHEAPHYPYQGPNDKGERTVGGKFDVKGAREDKKNAYREMVVELDNGVGAIVETLKKHKLWENTFVFFFSDNGATSLGSNGPLHGFKGSVWEGGHRVPGIAVWPGHIPADSHSDQTTISLDLFPTLAAVAGAKIPDGHQLDGINVLPLLLHNDELKERTLFWRHGKQVAARRGPWKVVVNHPKKAKHREPPALFDLSKDIGEKKDLSKVEPMRLKVMMDQLTAWEVDIGEDKFGSQK